MVRLGFGGLLGLLVGVLVVPDCSGTYKCAMYVMDQPGNSFGKMYGGKEMMQPAIDCAAPDMNIMKVGCAAWFDKINKVWSLEAPSRTRGAPFTIAQDLCGIINRTGKWTFGAFFTYCDKTEPMYTGKEREASTLCCKDGVPC